MAIPWDEVRKDFPALERRVYLNAAATGVPPPTVRPAVDAFGLIKDDRHLVVSASQSLGAFPVDVRRSGIDGLACAGHKWLGAGYGAGFVFIRGGLLVSRPPRALGWLSVERPFDFNNREF